MEDRAPDIKDIKLKHQPLSGRSLKIGCAAFILASGLLFYSCLPHPPADQKVIQNFQENQEHFEALVAMLQEDDKVGRITDRSLFERGRTFVDVPVEKLGITAERLETYRTHLDSTGVRSVSVWPTGVRGEHIEIFFLHWGWGGIDVWWHKGIVWSPVEPEPGAGYIHRPIDGNWYLYSDIPGEDGVTPVEQL